MAISSINKNNFNFQVVLMILLTQKLSCLIINGPKNIYIQRILKNPNAIQHLRFPKRIFLLHENGLSSTPLDTKPTKIENILIPDRIKKVRQHVNPLASSYQIPIKLDENWISKSFENPLLPMVVDIGCSKGTWALNYGQNNTNINILGLEIRKPVVEECLRRKNNQNAKNVHYLYANANIDLKRILDDINRPTFVEVITIQFPDPHFKKRHYKRRVVNTDLVKTIANSLQTGKHVFIQSDVLEVIDDINSYFIANSDFKPALGYNPLSESLQNNPSLTHVQTEREIATLAKDLPVYRMKFERI